jgi:4-amino-4-deoxy-L-arabinose transferase-like glycosyltransferase
MLRPCPASRSLVDNLSISHEREKFLVVIGGTILLALALAPWLLLVAQFAPRTPVANSYAALFYFEGLDDVLVRFWPLPLDLRSLRDGLHVQTPYLDAQLSTPLLILFVFLSVLRRPWQHRNLSTFVWLVATPHG